MKIVFAIKNLANAVGGAERVLCMICNDLVQKGHQVTIITFDSENSRPFYFLHKAVNIENLSLGNSTDKAQTFITLLRILKLRKVLKAKRPDIAVGFMHSMFIPLSFSLIGTGIPVIGSEHIVPEHYKSRRLEFFLFKISSFFMRSITVISTSIMESYPKCIKDKMVVISNPVMKPSDDFAYSSSERKNIHFLSVGRLSLQKDHKTLIDAFNVLYKEYPNCRLKIIGEGELRAQITKQIVSYNLENVISLPGVTSKIEIEYKQADIFVLSSIYESFGLVTAEAMSYGLPVIGFKDCQGTNELIEDGKTGLLIDNNGKRSELLAEGMKRLVIDESLREKLSQNGREFIKNSFSVSHITEQWECLFKKVVNNKDV